MKTLLKSITSRSILLFIVALFSCSEEEYYSCDNKTDNWVKDHLDEVSKMTRTDWINIGNIGYQRAIYNAFSPEQRMNLWLEKLVEAQNLLSKVNEKAHIEQLVTVIKSNPQWFSDSMHYDDMDFFDTFFYKWCMYASSELSWGNAEIYALIGTPEDIMMSESGDIQVELHAGKTTNLVTNKSEGQGYGKVCNCAGNSFACPYIDGFTCEIEYDDPCRVTEHGCGFLWYETCYGTCKAWYEI